MEPAQAPVERDPEFRPQVHARRVAEDMAPGVYQRLLANPFLGLLGLMAWVGMLRHLIVRGLAGPADLVLGLVVLLSGLGLPRLFHYHCLDCGKTGPLLRWKQHLCPRVAERHFAGRPRRFRGPPPTVQIIVWLYVLLMILVALNALGVGVAWLRRP